MNDSTSIPAPLISTGQPDMEAPDVTSEWSDHSLNLLGIPAFTKEQKDAWAARFDGLPEEDFSLVFWEQQQQQQPSRITLGLVFFTSILVVLFTPVASLRSNLFEWIGIDLDYGYHTNHFLVIPFSSKTLFALLVP
ncbi:hypothetical protein BGZ83_008313 [Gryganskiella cystojenkinii]|nr:hypothetical protein BGZ83_008313 [Gryganskiella cystojenkinii]